MKAIHLCLLAAACVMSAPVVQADEALAKSKNCLSCHCYVFLSHRAEALAHPAHGEDLRRSRS